MSIPWTWPGGSYRYALDPEPRFIETSAGLEKLVGCDAETLASLSPADFLSMVDVNDRKILIRRHLEHVADKSTPEAVEFCLQGPDGQLRVLLDQQRRDEASVPGHRIIQGVLVDITAARKSANRPQSAGPAITTRPGFLASASHELRTPMNAILGMSQLALNVVRDEQLRRYLDRINIAADTLLALVNDLLDASKIDAGKFELDAAPFTLSDIINKVTALNIARAEEKGLELIIDVAEQQLFSLTFLGDALRLGQVLVNLVGNAIKFTEEGQVAIRIRLLNRNEASTTLQFEVSDTGIGIAKEQQARMFQPFSQADQSIIRRYGGTGLGLAISKDIVSKLGGEIWLESEHGNGTTFSFTAKLATQAASPLSDRQTFNLQILIVDDNKTSRLVLGQLLRNLGCEVDECSSAEDGLKALMGSEHSHYDAVIADWRMPGMDGAAFGEAMRNYFSEQNRPQLAIISAFSSIAQLEGAVGTVSDTLLSKPIDMRELSRFLEKVEGSEEVSTGSVANAQRPMDGLRLLLVEDNVVNQEVAVDMLTSAGAVVTVANHGQEALVLLRTQIFDCVLMDCQMPVMDGFLTTQQLRLIPGLRALPVLAVSASALEEDRKHAFASGMDAFLSKPYKLKDLYESILRLVPQNTQKSKESGPAIESFQAQVTEHSKEAENKVALTGIDYADAVERLGGEPRRFWLVCKRFTETTTGFSDRVLNALDSDDYEGARREAHSLQSLAGTIGATILQRRVLALELALRDGVSPYDFLRRSNIELERVNTLLTEVAEQRSFAKPSD